MKWENRQRTNPTLRKITRSNGTIENVNITDVEDNIVKSGTPLNAENMNIIEKNIGSYGEDTFDSTKEYNLGDIVRYNGRFYKYTAEYIDFDGSSNTTSGSFDESDWEEIGIFDITMQSYDKMYNNAGAHNSIYRGKNITDLFYSGKFSEQVSNGTFDDIYIGDFIIGKTSKTKYYIADIDYYLYTGNPRCETHHIVIVPDTSIGNSVAMTENSTVVGYLNTSLYTNNLTEYKEIIKGDLGQTHILSHKNRFYSTISNNKYTASSMVDSDIDLMNEKMVYGCNIFGIDSSISVLNSNTIDKSQLSLFRLDKSKIICKTKSGSYINYWLRDATSSDTYAIVNNLGCASVYNGVNNASIRPSFVLI